MKKIVSILLSLGLVLPLLPLTTDAAQINRLHQSTISNGSVINASDLNDEYNLLLNESNAQDTRLNTLEGLNKGVRSSAPFGATPGNLWYNTTTNQFQGQLNTGTATLVDSTELALVKNLFPGFVAGRAPEYVDTNSIRLRAGLRAAESSGNHLMVLPSDTTLNLSVLGLNGLDAGVEASNTWYYVWLIKNSSTGAVGGLLSVSSTAPVMPSGYDQKRRLPLAVRNDASSNIIDFYVAAGWPARPEIRYNVNIGDIQGAGQNNVLWQGSATSFTDVSLSSFVPPISRASLLKLEYYFSSAQGSFRVREKGKTHEGFQFMANPANNTSDITVQIPCDTSQTVQYRASTSAQADSIWVLGYIVTETD